MLLSPQISSVDFPEFTSEPAAAVSSRSEEHLRGLICASGRLFEILCLS